MSGFAARIQNQRFRMLSEIFQSLAARLYIASHQAIAFILPQIGLNVFATKPTKVYGRFPDSPIVYLSEYLYSNYWTFPDDYHLEEWQSTGLYLAMAFDKSGCCKLYQYNPVTLQLLDLHENWAAEITKEGTIIWYGPQNDPSPKGEICIITPFGWNLNGLPLGKDLSVSQNLVFASNNWDKDEAFERQVFYITYGTTRPRIMMQEVTWDTDTDAPCVQTHYPSDNLHRFNVKEYAAFWYQGTKVTDYTYEYVPNPVYGNIIRIGELQIRIAKGLYKSVLNKYAAEPDKFDAFRYKEP